MIGPLIGAQDVCQHVEDTLRDWLPSVCAEIALAGGPALSDPTTYDMPSPEALTSGQAELPAVVVSSPGIVENGTARDEDMTYHATWTVVISVFARGDGYRDTAARVRGFALAARVCLVQHPLPGFASEVLWVGEEYAALDSRAARTLGAGFVTFRVTVESVTDAAGGPLSPPALPDSLITEGVQALTTTVNVEEMA